MSPKVPRLRWDDPFRALDMLSSLWSSAGLPSVSAGAAQAVAAPYRTLFTTLQQLLIGKEVTVRIVNHDVVLTVTEQLAQFDPEVIDMMMLWSAPQDVPPPLVERCLEIFATEVRAAFRPLRK